MAFEKYIIPNLNRPHTKRGGYVTLIILLSAMMIIIPILALTSGQLMKFSDFAGMIMRQQHERIAVSKSINKSMEFLSSSGIYSSMPEDALINPGSSAELLVHKDSEITGGYTLSSEIYNMNYVISGDINIPSDIFNFPPSRKNAAGEKHFLIKTTIHKNDVPSRREETAAALTPSGEVNELWSREIIIY